MKKNNLEIYPKEKPFTTVDEQIHILQSRNMIIDKEDEKKIKQYLLKSTYYNVINSCGFLFKQSYKNKAENRSEDFVDNTTFFQVYSVYQFENFLKNKLMKEILKFESTIKAVIIYVFNKNHQYNNSYLNYKNYNLSKKSDSKKLIDKLDNKINKAKRLKKPKDIYNNAISNYQKTHNELPLWILAKELDFGIIKWFYDVMKIDEKKEVSQELINIYNFNNKLSGRDKYFLSFEQLFNHIEILHQIRNTVAHNNSLLFYEGENIKIHKLLFRKRKIANDSNYYKLFYVIAILELYLNTDDYDNLIKSLKKEIKIIKRKITAIDPNLFLSDILGFPVDWEKE